jgi:hypothetical protein|tara:strand:- start:555 stop:776 length:222 start_codon:yes stop_codon:yes gene_type:complete
MLVGFIKKNTAMIVSLILAYLLVNATIEYWPGWIYLLSGQKVDWDLAKYRWPIIVIAFIFYPAVSWIKMKLEW